MARSSSRLRSEESSSHSGAFSSSLQARTTRGQSRAATLPLRSLSFGIRDRQAMKRWASSASDISSEKKATGFPCLEATFSAMLQTSADLPSEGRAAITIRLPGWKPPSFASRSRKPEGVPVIVSVALRQLLEAVDLVVEDLGDLAEVAGALLVGDLEQQRSRRARRAARGSPSRSWTDFWICCEVASRRRSSEFCLTICA